MPSSSMMGLAPTLEPTAHHATESFQSLSKITIYVVLLPLCRSPLRRKYYAERLQRCVIVCNYWKRPPGNLSLIMRDLPSRWI